jgi:hypothetical protein
MLCDLCWRWSAVFVSSIASSAAGSCSACIFKGLGTAASKQAMTKQAKPWSGRRLFSGAAGWVNHWVG